MPSTNENRDKAPSDDAVRLVGAVAASDAIAHMTAISTFNLATAVRALQSGMGGTLTFHLPSQRGKAAQVVYEGLAPTR